MNFLLKVVNNFLYKLFYYFIVFYQKLISPLLPARCRYYPTCSNYGKQALAWHGVRAGSWLLLKRISSCHPLGGHGIDFVPLPLSSYHYQYVPFNALATSVKVQGLYVFRDNKGYVSRLNHMMKRT
ncbi:MAG: membrane protein insertion efficiency factor YidD [Psychrobacter sp.]|nr:membrane protein insertion efficiency factor YidD [Psychrobacter sp.]